MSTHQHRKATERGPYGCADGVGYVVTCACGAERAYCTCQQCRMQGKAKSRWEMPVCRACKLRHPIDTACAATGQSAGQSARQAAADWELAHLRTR